MAGRSFFTTLQEQMESGGRQHDKSGKPLVGRYRDGSTPAPGKEAYGAGQMQIGTARNTAKQFGIAWDEKKFLNDKDYNLTLADKHMEYLVGKYGDMNIARGAYHSGEPNVDRAIAKYGRANFAQGLGPEGRNYVKMGTKGAGGSTPVTVEDITQVGATSGEKAALGQPYGGLANPFNNAGVAKAVDTMQNRTSLADTILQQAMGESKEIRTQQLQEIDSTVAAKKKLYEHGEETTNALINAATPIFQQRKQIQERRSEVARMNPFLAAVKGVIDPDYNSDALESRDNILRGDLALLDEEFTHQNKLHENLIQIATAKSSDQNVLYNAQLSNLGEDVRLAIQSYEMGGALLDAEMKSFQTDSALVAAQTQQRNKSLNEFSTGQINELLLTASANESGVAEANGMPFPKQLLMEEQTRRQEQAYHMGSLKLNIMQGNQAMVEVAQDKALKTMNLDQIREGLDNNGVIDGVQFDQVKLGARAEDLRKVSQGQAQDAVMSTVGGQWAAQVQRYTDTSQGYMARLGSMFGTVPPQYSNMLTANATQLANVSRQIKQLAASGNEEAARQLAAGTMPEIQAMLTQRDKVVDEMVTRWSGGNADLKTIGVSWAQGTQVEPGAALRGLVYMARNGPPAGMRFQGTAAKVYNTVVKATRNWDSKQTGENLLKGTKDAKENELIQQISSQLGGIFSSDLITETMVDAPNTARSVKVNGRVHPFTTVSRQLMSDAMNYGDRQGYVVGSTEFGSGDPAGFKAMIQQGPQGDIWRAVAPGLKGDKANFSYWQDVLKTAQSQKMFEYLDQNRTDAMPAAPSTMLKDLMSRPEFLESARNKSLISERGTLGGFVAGAASSGGFENAMSNYTQRTVAAHRTYRDQRLASISDKGVQLRTQPVARTHYILSTIPGISSEDESYLLNHLKQTVPLLSAAERINNVPDLANPFNEAPDMLGEKAWNQVTSAINTKMDDPRAESIRRRIAPQWDLFDKSAAKMSTSPWYAGGN